MLLNETDRTSFLFRRDRSITLPLDRAILTRNGLPFLAPEIVLVYKSKDAGSEANAKDFASVLPHLDTTQRSWLKQALQKATSKHPWLHRLT